MNEALALSTLHDEKAIRKALGVYLGREALRAGPVLVLPLRQFLERLYAGDVLA